MYIGYPTFNVLFIASSDSNPILSPRVETPTVTVSIAAPATNNYYAITTSTTPPVGLATASATVSISGGRLNTVTISYVH